MKPQHYNDQMIRLIMWVGEWLSLIDSLVGILTLSTYAPGLAVRFMMWATLYRLEHTKKGL